MDNQLDHESASYGSFPLALAAEGEIVKIVFVRGGRKKEERLMSMGLKVGDTIKIQISNPGGGKVVQSGETRYALNRSVSQSVTVVKI